MEKIDSGSRFLPKGRAAAYGEEVRERNFSPPFNRHEGYELVYLLEGKCRVRVESKEYPLRPDELLFIAEGEYHCALVNDRCRIAYLDFQPGLLFSHPELVGRFLRPFLNGLSGGSHKLLATPSLLAQVKVVAAAVEKNDGDPLRPASEMLKLVAYFDRLRLPAGARAEALRRKIQPALDLIYTAYGDNLTVMRLAAACAQSRPAFYRHFLAALGKSPKTVLNGVRLDRAMNLLISTSRKVSDIALSCGFQNLSHFNRRFRRKFGRPPLAFRPTRM